MRGDQEIVGADHCPAPYAISEANRIFGFDGWSRHHLRFAQPRGLGMKVSDEFTVPLCRGHHRQLHQAGSDR
jgi:hypothetical protein